MKKLIEGVITREDGFFTQYSTKLTEKADKTEGKAHDAELLLLCLLYMPSIHAPLRAYGLIDHPNMR